MIKAYHQVGSDDWTSGELSEALMDLVSAGKIEPASKRLDRGEMEAECFDPERGADLKERFPKASPKVMAALEQIARKRINKLPETGFTHSLFGCLDLLAGDLDLIFLKPRGWYSLPNGFVFDAEELLMKGGRFRGEDLLGGYVAAVEGASKKPFGSVASARRFIEHEFQDIRHYFESTGREAIEALRHTRDLEEIVWPGDLPLGMAIEAWRDGRNITRLIK